MPPVLFAVYKISTSRFASTKANDKCSGATFTYDIPESLPGVRATSETGTKLLQSFESAMRLSIIVHVTLGLQKPQHLR